MAARASTTRIPSASRCYIRARRGLHNAISGSKRGLRSFKAFHNLDFISALVASLPTNDDTNCKVRLLSPRMHELCRLLALPLFSFPVFLVIDTRGAATLLYFGAYNTFPPPFFLHIQGFRMTFLIALVSTCSALFRRLRSKYLGIRCFKVMPCL